jgi:hypothetical protein
MCGTDTQSATRLSPQSSILHLVQAVLSTQPKEARRDGPGAVRPQPGLRLLDIDPMVYPYQPGCHIRSPSWFIHTDRAGLPILTVPCRRLFLARTSSALRHGICHEYDVDSFEASIKAFVTMQMANQNRHQERQLA